MHIIPFPAADREVITVHSNLSDSDAVREPTVSGADLVRELYACFKRHLVIGKEEALALALWTLHTYALDTTDTSPRLAITSPTKRCGKTTLFRILTYLVHHAESLSNISAAAIYRSIEAESPTLLIDEGDTLNLRDNRELLNVLNSGHTRETAYVKRCVGKEFEPRKFPTWTPVAVALIGKLPDTLEDRSIEIPMRRKHSTESVQRFTSNDQRELKLLADKSARFVADKLPALKRADPEIPDSLDDRAADNWRPLLAIADLIGPPWAERARKAAVKLSRRREGTVGDNSELLRDIKRLFEESGKSFLGSQEIVEGLTRDAILPWATCQNGQPLSECKLARLLGAFGIHPASDGRKRGYHRRDFNDAFSRYLPS